MENSSISEAREAKVVVVTIPEARVLELVHKEAEAVMKDRSQYINHTIECGPPKANNYGGFDINCIVRKT